MTEQQLRKFGFSGFVHLNPMSRDTKKRMVWSGVYNEQLIAIRIIFTEEEQLWVLEDVFCDLSDDKLKELLRRRDIDSVLDFIKSIRK